MATVGMGVVKARLPGGVQVDAWGLDGVEGDVHTRKSFVCL